METINLSHYPAARAAGVVVDYINCKLGGPHQLFEQQQVTSASKESIESVGNKYRLELTITDALNERPPIKCTAEVLYYTNNPQSAPNVTYTLEAEPQNYTAQKDKEFYDKIKSRTELLVAKDIPDKYGNVAPDMEPILHLGQAASGCVKWQNSTEGTFYRMTVIESVKQVKTESAALELHYVLLIHDMVSQEMLRYSMEVLWDLSGLQVKNPKLLPKINPDAISS